MGFTIIMLFPYLLTCQFISLNIVHKQHCNILMFHIAFSHIPIFQQKNPNNNVLFSSSFILVSFLCFTNRFQIILGSAPRNKIMCKQATLLVICAV